MERIRNRKPSSTTKGSNISTDELALAKAAAWAWFEHGSGSELGRAVLREYDHLALPTKTDTKPSRYKLEAAAMIESKQELIPPKLITPPLSPLSTYSTASNSSSTEISLLDDYEIERISKQIHLSIESSRDEYLRSLLGGADHLFFGTSEPRSKPKKKEEKNWRGFWSKYAAICGPKSGDVVDVVRSFKAKNPRGGRRKRM